MRTDRVLRTAERRANEIIATGDPGFVRHEVGNRKKIVSWLLEKESEMGIDLSAHIALNQATRLYLTWARRTDDQQAVC